MADVSRGQLIVVVGLLLAALFVGLALVVNSAIFTENLATRDTGTDPREGLEERHHLNQSIAQSIDRINANVQTTSYEGVETALEDVIENQSDAKELIGAERGTVVDIERNQANRGTRLRQTDTSRNFTDKSGNPDWELTSEPTEGGQVTMQVAADSLYNSTYDTSMSLLAESAFAIEFHPEDESGTWRIFLFQGAATNAMYAVVEHPDQEFQDEDTSHLTEGWLDQACSMRGDVLTLQLRTTQFGGTDCDEFDFYNELGPHRMSFTNAYTSETDPLYPDSDVDRAIGSYDILLEGETANTDSFHPPYDGDQPFYHAAIFSHDISLTYETRGSTYTIDHHTVTPMDHDSGGILWEFPSIDVFEPDRVGSGDFEITWRVSDPDGRLAEAELLLVDTTTDDVEVCLPLLGCSTVPLDGNEIVDRQTLEVSGPYEEGEDTLSAGSLSGVEEFVVIIYVQDESGRTTVESEVFEVNV